MYLELQLHLSKFNKQSVQRENSDYTWLEINIQSG